MKQRHRHHRPSSAGVVELPRASSWRIESPRKAICRRGQAGYGVEAAVMALILNKRQNLDAGANRPDGRAGGAARDKFAGIG